MPLSKHPPRFRVSGVACRGGGPSLMAGSGHWLLFLQGAFMCHPVLDPFSYRPVGSSLK